MTVSLAVVRGLISREDARTAVTKRSPSRSATAALGLPQEIAEDARDVSRLPQTERDSCLKLFREFAPLAASAAASSPPPPPPAVAPVKLPFVCPDCGAKYKISSSGAQKAHRCPKCSGTLKPQDTSVPGAPDPGSTFGKYQIQGELGRGGMGVVYKAWDPKAGRTVAIKVMLRCEDEKEVQRFEREAQTALALKHEGIVAVYDVGIVGTTPYMAMEFVPGRPLSDLLNPHRPKEEKLTLERALELIRDAALALGHAHEKRIVHRDVKPQNIMVDDSGKVRMMDFGLARELKRGLTVTATGDVIGTPQYMSPEQAVGDRHRMGPWTDVWALGVMLYEAAAKSSPFEGSSAAEVLHQITHRDAEPLRKRNPRLARDLETIVMKCLESDPRDRYGTATKLAQDLGRYLDGVPVLARPAGPVRKIRKLLVRRKGVALTAAGGLVAVGVVAALLLPALGREKERVVEVVKVATVAKNAALDQLRETTGAALSAALGFRQQGRQEEMQKYLKQTEQACRKAMAEMPQAAEPHYRLGRMYRAMMKDDEALLEQEKALEKDPAEMRALYERVVLVARLYLKQIHELEKKALAEEGERLTRAGKGTVQGGAAWKKPSRDELTAKDEKATSLLKRVEADLMRLQTARSGISPGETECAAGLRAWVRKETDEARRLFAAALEKSPYLEEAFETAGTIEADAERLEEAIGWWTKGIERDRGYLPHRENRAETQAQLALNLSLAGKPFDAGFEAAVKDLDEVLQKDPIRLPALLGRSHALANWGLARASVGKDFESQFQATMKSDEAVLKLDPRNYPTWLGRGMLKMNWAYLKGFRGEDPVDLLGEAVADLDKAIEIKPENAHAWISRGNALSMRGDRVANRGQDPTRDYEAALRDFGEALRRKPDSAECWKLRAMTRAHWADLKGNGTMASDALRADAIRDFDESLKLDAGQSLVWLERGKVKGDWALRKNERGEDAEALFQEAFKDCDEAVRLNPKNDEALASRGTLRANRALGRAQKGENVNDELERAVTDLDEAIRLNPTRAGHWLMRGFVRGNLAVMKQLLNQDPVPFLKSAVEDLDQAIKIRPGNAEQHFRRGFFQFQMSHLLKEPDRTAGFRSALKDFDEALRLNPGFEPAIRPLLERARKQLGE